jgi:hypothetical protein
MEQIVIVCISNTYTPIRINEQNFPQALKQKTKKNVHIKFIIDT